MERKSLETEKKADAPQTDDAESITDFPCVVIGLLFSLRLSGNLRSAACEKGIVLSNGHSRKDGERDEVRRRRTDREMRELRSLRRPRRRMRRQDGSTARRAGGTQRMPQRTTSTAGQISTETSTILIPMVTWRPAGKRSAEKAVTLMTRVFTSQTATAR